MGRGGGKEGRRKVLLLGKQAELRELVVREVP